MQGEHRPGGGRALRASPSGARVVTPGPLGRANEEERMHRDRRSSARVGSPEDGERTVQAELPGGPLGYLLRRSPRSRGLRITVHPERGVVVSIPPSGRRGWAQPESRIEAFLATREAWIRRHLAEHARRRQALAARPPLAAGRVIPFVGRPHTVWLERAGDGRTSVRHDAAGARLVIAITARERRSPEAILEAWLRDRARAAIGAAVERHAPGLGVRPVAVTVRDARTRWGSCSRAGRLSLSWRLILAPPEALETVVVHELCHLRLFGHGPRFRALLAGQVPDHARWRRWLHDHSSELHAALQPSEGDRAAA